MSIRMRAFRACVGVAILGLLPHALPMDPARPLATQSPCRTWTLVGSKSTCWMEGWTTTWGPSREWAPRGTCLPATWIAARIWRTARTFRSWGECGIGAWEILGRCSRTWSTEGLFHRVDVSGFSAGSPALPQGYAGATPGAGRATGRTTTPDFRGLHCSIRSRPEVPPHEVGERGDALVHLQALTSERRTAW